MVTDQEVQGYAGTALPAGEPVTLVIDEERFFGASRRRQPIVSRAWRSNLNEAPTGSRNLSRWKISSDSEIICKRIRSYARRRRTERRCGHSDSGGWGHLRCDALLTISILRQSRRFYDCWPLKGA